MLTQTSIPNLYTHPATSKLIVMPFSDLPQTIPDAVLNRLTRNNVLYAPRTNDNFVYIKMHGDLGKRVLLNALERHAQKKADLAAMRRTDAVLDGMNFTILPHKGNMVGKKYGAGSGLVAKVKVAAEARFFKPPAGVIVHTYLCFESKRFAYVLPNGKCIVDSLDNSLGAHIVANEYLAIALCDRTVRLNAAKTDSDYIVGFRHTAGYEAKIYAALPSLTY